MMNSRKCDHIKTFNVSDLIVNSIYDSIYNNNKTVVCDMFVTHPRNECE